MAMSPFQPFTYTDAQKMVEFELNGKTEKFSIYDALALWSKEEYEASLPPEMREKDKEGEDGGEPKTPVCAKSTSKKRGKAPRYSTPKNPTLTSTWTSVRRSAGSSSQRALAPAAP